MSTRRRGRGEGSIVRRADGRWMALVDLGWHDGNRRRKAFYGKSRAAVRDKLTKALRDAQQGLPIPSERQTLGQYLHDWLTGVATPRVRPLTLDGYRDTVERRIEPHLGHIPLARLTPQHVQAWLGTLEAAGVSGRGRRYARVVLRAALTQAVKWNLTPRNVAALVDPPRASLHEMQPLTPDEARAFLKATGGHRLEAFYSVALALGLRRGEALGLRWQDVDIENGTISIRQALQRFGGNARERRRINGERRELRATLKTARAELVAAPPECRTSVKSRVDTLATRLRELWTARRAVGTTLQIAELKSPASRRTIVLPAVVRSALKSHRVRQLEERLAAGGAWRDHGLVFTTRIGTPVDPRNATREFKRLLKAANLPAVRFHDLRHTAATLLLVQGVSPRTVMETLGHSAIAMTLETYSHVLPELRREAAAQMDAILGRS